MRAPHYLALSAWLEHAPFLFWMMETLRPRCFVELGTHYGYSYFTACQAVEELGLGTACYAVDTWQGDKHAGSYGEEVFCGVQAYNQARYSRFSQLIRATFDDAANCFPDQSIDLLHIDGRHFYEDVRHDYETWRPKLTDASVVLFHDTNVYERGFGVWKLFHELSREYPAFEFKHNYGLGVVAPGGVPPPLAPLFAADERTVDFLRTVYPALGNAITLRWSLSVKDEELRNAVGERESKLAELREQLAGRQRDVAELQDLLASERENAARREEELNAAITNERRRVRSLESEISVGKARAQYFDANIVEKRALVQRLEANMVAERDRRQHLEAQLEHVSRDRDKLIKSVSWRITEPIRAIHSRYPRATRSAVNAARTVWLIGTFRYSRLASVVRTRARLRREERIVAESGLFDSDFYLKSNPDASGIDRTPLWHYLVRGWWEGCRPHPLFDGAWYLGQYPEVAQAAINPLVHFVKVGAAEYRNPNPLFDTRWYVTMNPDVISSGINPLVHYATIGAARRADPSPAFSTAWYLDQNPEVVALGTNPLEHYLLRGRAEGRWPRLPAPDLATARPVTEARIECRKYPTVQKETALFVTHSSHGHLKPHVRGYLEALVREGISVIVIVAADEEFIGDEPWLYELVGGLFVRPNEGFDFSAWAHVIRLHRELYSAEILYLLNDSVIGPVNEPAFHAALERLRRAPADFVGMTENYERAWHIQSYFLALKRRALQSRVWQQFVLDIVSFTDKDDVINTYEVQLAPKLAAAGLACLALFPAKSRVNQTLFNWRQLLGEGFPFIKVMAIRGDLAGADNSGWREALHHCGFDTTVVDRVLAEGTIQDQRESVVYSRPARSAVPAAPRRFPRIAFIGPWNYDNGLGFGARGYLSALMRTSYEVNFLPIVKPFHVHQRLAPSVEYRDFVGPPDIAIVHLNPEAWNALITTSQFDILKTASIKIGLFVWETAELSLAFHETLKKIDAVWTPSQYCADIFRSATDAPVHVVPHVVQVPGAMRGCRCEWAEDCEVQQWLRLEPENKVILFAFDSSSSLARKNPFALVAAFRRAGLASAGWRLILKTKLSSDDKANADTLRTKIAECPGALLIDRPLGGEAMARLMEAAEIYASPHSSEGFGLTIAEAMAMGKTVVATDYGGSRDFLDCKTGFPVRWSPWRLDRQEGPYAKGSTWARVDETHLAESLVAAATLSDEERRGLGERARERIRERLAPKAVAAEMRTSIENLLRTGMAL